MNERVSVRSLIYQVVMGQASPRYTADSAGSVIVSDTGAHTRMIIGFAEFPKNTSVPDYDNFEDFKQFVEANAEYVHWREDNSIVN